MISNCSFLGVELAEKDHYEAGFLIYLGLSAGVFGSETQKRILLVFSP